MVLQEIDKVRYQRHLRFTFVGIAVALAVLSIAISAVLIHFFSTADESHFWFNLFGVAVAAVLVVYLLYRLRHHAFLHEVAYVWNLKQMLNRIYRKQSKLEQFAEQNDHDAMHILNFQYHGSKQLYQLDDNTVTIDELMLKLKRLQGRMRDAGVDPSVSGIDPSMLEKY